MPDDTDIQKIKEALRTGKTDITRALDRLFTNPDPGSPHPLKGHQNFVAMDNGGPGILDNLANIPGVDRMLLDRGVSPGEIDHINDWPNGQKESVREKLLRAVNDNTPIHFYWELHHGGKEETDIQDPDQAGEITVTFRSPWANASGNVIIRVGQ